MKMHHSFLCTVACGAVVALSGCITQPTQSAAAPSTAAAPATPTTAGAVTGVLGSMLSNGGAAQLLSSLNVPASGTASNAAGVLTYCAQNNYLKPDKAGTIANQLLSSLGLPTTAAAATAAPTQDAGYLSGVAGMIVSPTGELFSLDKIKGNVKDKACEFVLDQSKRFL
jgi:hypothetical protein